MIEITIYDNGSINPAPQEIVETANDLAAIRAFERYLSKAKMQWNIIDIDPRTQRLRWHLRWHITAGAIAG